MPDWTWLLLGLAAGAAISASAALVLVPRVRAGKRGVGAAADSNEPLAAPVRGTVRGLGETPARRRILVVDDDPALRVLLRATLAADEFELEEASSAEEADQLARFWRPDVVILDVGLPGTDGLVLCSDLKRKSAFGPPRVIVLTGGDTTEREAADAGADALLCKPFSPLELVGLLERVSERPGELLVQAVEADGEQLLLYARDLNRLLEIERANGRLLQQAYRQTATALADALEAKDLRTGQHALRVQQYALELSSAIEPGLLDDPSLEYGFLLHDIGKIAIPDPVLNKPGPLTPAERELVQEHPLIGVDILKDVELLQGEGLRVVRSHHERWDGDGYPDQLAGPEIPIGARIFALADTLDAMTSERPYRPSFTWDEAIDEILAQDGRQFDPRVVSAFAAREQRLRRIHTEFSAYAAAQESG